MKKLWVLGLCFWLHASILAAASGVVSFNRIDVPVKIDKLKENITCLQDARDESQWYYVTNRPRLAETKKGQPMFSLVSYQESKKMGVKEAGGVLQAAFNLSLQEDVIQQLVGGIKKIAGLKKIKLAPLDMKSAKICIYAPGGEQIATAQTAPDIGPSFANESVPVQMNLTKLGVPVVDALLKGTGGIQVYFIFEYDALTPEASLKITANWDQMYKHFSSKTSILGGYSGLFFNSQHKADFETARDELVKNNCIKIESIGSSELTNEEINKITEPVITKINEMFFNMKEPDKVEPVKNKDVDTGRGLKFHANSSFALKSVENIQKGSYTFDLTRRSIVTRKTSVGGIISLGDYTDEIRKAAITTVDPTYWKNAVYSLPNISKRLSGIDEITVAVNFLYDGKQAKGTEQQIAKWAPKQGWVDAEGEEVTCLVFPLKYFYDNYENKSKDFSKKIAYKQSFEISYMEGNNTKIKKFEDVVPAFTGEIPLSSPMVGALYVEVAADEDALTFKGGVYEDEEYDGIKADLSKIMVSLESSLGKETGKGILKPSNTELSFWFDKAKDKKTGKFIDPKIKAVYTYYSTKIAKAVGSPDKKTIVVETKDALEGGPSITLTNDDYLPVDKPEGLK